MRPRPLRAVRRLACTAAFAACTWFTTAHAADYQLTVIADQLEHPWSIAFLPEGDMLVTEREGRLRIIRNGGLDPEPIEGVPEVYVRGQGGLLEVTLHPAFEQNGWIYLSYADGDAGSNATRVVRAHFNGTQLSDITPIFEVEPRKATPVHYGGRMLFLPDGTLLITTGDGFVHREQAQDLSSLMGKIVRVNDDGSIPSDNPFVERNDARPEIYAFGVRNVQGITRDRNSGRLFFTDHGPRGGDELHDLEPGLNYGWPLITYGIDYTGARISPFTEMPGTEQPLHYWETAIAPGGLDWYGGDMFPEWQGDFFVAALAGHSVIRVRIDGGRATDTEVLFEDLDERIRQVRAGPDGALYLLIDSAEGQVIRVSRGL